MLALVNRDMTEAGRSLNTLCENYRYYDQELLSFEKLFCTPAHGLYNFARRVLSETEFSRLEMPSSPTFSESSPYGNEIIITLPENKH